jgi:hypothetical protein
MVGTGRPASPVSSGTGGAAIGRDVADTLGQLGPLGAPLRDITSGRASELLSAVLTPSGGRLRHSPLEIERRVGISLPANGRSSVAPGGDCVCHAYRRPIVRSHCRSGHSSDRSPGCPISSGLHCRHSGSPVRIGLHCRDIVLELVFLAFRSKGRTREPHTHERGNRQSGRRHGGSSLIIHHGSFIHSR